MEGTSAAGRYVDGSGPYEAHIVRKSDGAEVEVQVSSDFTVAAVNAMGDRCGKDNDGPDAR